MQQAGQAGPLQGQGIGWLEAIPTALLLVDDRGVVQQLNPAARVRLGSAAEALPGQVLGQVLGGPDLRASHWTSADGRRLPLRWGGRLADSGLTPVTLGEAETAASPPAEALHAQILDMLHDGVLLYDESGHFVGANRSACQILGLSQDRLLQASADELGWLQVDEHGQPMPLQDRPVWRVLHGQPAVEATTLGVDTGDGVMRWLLINAVRTPPLVPGQSYGVVASFADISRQMSALRALRESEQQVTRLLATAPGALFTYRRAADGQVKVTLANPRVLEAYRLPGTEGPPPDLRELVDPEDRIRLKQALEESARTLKPWREEFRMRHPKRGQIWVELNAMPTPEDGGALAWHGFVHEVTARKRIEAEMRNHNAELEARVAERTAELQARHREMEAFTYSVSHDLKAPLRGIDGYSRLLQTEHLASLNEEGRFFVETIRKATVHMGRLIDDLLAYSRVERSRPTLLPLDPLVLIGQAVAERRQDLAGIEVHLPRAEDGACTQAVGERDGVLMVLRNLVDNAIKFTAQRPERCLQISCERVVDEQGAARCRMAVRDNGPGFDMRYHDRIFEIFQRLHRAEEVDGTGVGLAIVRKAVERMNGRVWAESAPGQGATFFVELPV